LVITFAFDEGARINPRHFFIVMAGKKIIDENAPIRQRKYVKPDGRDDEKLLTKVRRLSLRTGKASNQVNLCAKVTARLS